MHSCDLPPNSLHSCFPSWQGPRGSFLSLADLGSTSFCSIHFLNYFLFETFSVCGRALGATSLLNMRIRVRGDSLKFCPSESRLFGRGKPSRVSHEVRARNIRLDNIAKDWAELEPDAWPTGTSTGGGRGQAPVSSHREAAKPSDGQLLSQGLLLDELGKPLVSPILARDACKCSECIDPSDRQRNFSYADIPTGISFSKVSRAGNDGNSIVSWNNDAPPHSTGKSAFFDRETIASLRKPFRNPRWRLYNLPQRLWDAKSFTQEINRVDFNEYINDDDTLTQALRLLWRDGLLFVDGVPESEKSVSRIVQRIGPLMTTFYGPTWDVRSVSRREECGLYGKIPWLSYGPTLHAGAPSPPIPPLHTQ